VGPQRGGERGDHTRHLRLRTVASFHDPLDQYAWYQRTDNVRGGNSRKSPPLNDMTTTRRLGTAR